MKTCLLRLVGYVLATVLLTAIKTSAQGSTNCALVINCPSNIVVTNCFNVQEFYNPTASNICCGVNSTVYCTPPSGSIFAVGTTTTVNCTATDCAQNTNYCSFTVTVVRGTKCATNYLEIQCPSNIVVTSCTNIQEFYAPTVTDLNCTNWTVVCAPPSGSFFAPNTTNLVDCYVTDYCGESNSCSFMVTVLQGPNCATNCINLECPSNIVLTTCSNCAQAFYTATATNSCCFDHVLLNYSPASGACFPLGTNTVQVTAYDPDCASTPPTTCNFTVTVIQNNSACCGLGLGPQTIQWLQFPTNGTIVSDPAGANPQGSWIVTNLGCYGNVLVTQNFPDLVYWFLNPNSAGVPNGNGLFNFTDPGYGPYLWGTGSWMDFYASNNDNYTVNFYFLDGPPNPCSLVLGIDGLAESTVATVSQPVTFRTEFDLNAPLSDGTASAHTTLNNIYGPSVAGTIGTAVGSAYFLDSYGDNRNTGWAILQPANNLPTTNLATGSVQGYSGPLNNLPYLSLNVSQQAGDGIGFTVGYICCTPCPTNCLQIQCSSNKTVQCGSEWTFDPPIASSCCTNMFYSSTGLGTNVLITSTGFVTNGNCPTVYITESWAITDGCGDSTNCSQTVTVLGCCTNGFTNGCCGPGIGLQTIQWLQLPTDIIVAPNPTGSNTNRTWIITNLPCYGNVLITEDAPTNVVALYSNSDFGRVHSISSFAYVPNPAGAFEFTETSPGTYGPYTWGPTPGAVELGCRSQYLSNGQGAPLPPYNVTFYFLDGQPNPCSLILSSVGMAQNTTNTLSQPFIFRTEYDLSNSFTYPTGPSAETMVDGIYGSPLMAGLAGTVIGSAYASNGGDDFNTGWVILQPTNSLLTTNLPSGSGMDINGNSFPSSSLPVPFINVTVNHEYKDVFSLTLGYLCCPNSCLQVDCPSNKTVQCGADWTFDLPIVASCCTNTFGTSTGPGTNVLITSTGFVTNGICPTVDITETWLITDACGDSNICSQTVTVVGCCSNQPCCGPYLGPQTISWLQYPNTNAPSLLPNPLNNNAGGTWIITNLPHYGNVLVTQSCPYPTNDLYWFLNANLENALGPYGSFQYVEGGYGPYSWGTFGSLLDFYNDSTGTIHYNVNFYFLNGQPNYCTLFLGVVGLAENTTATVSQAVVFRGEYDLAANAPGGNGSASANSMLNGLYAAAVPGTTGTIVGSAYSSNSVGDPVNTGWALLQPTNNLFTTNLPTGSGTDLNGNPYPSSSLPYPYLTLTVNQQSGDGIGFTVGYTCCTNPCLIVQCPANKTVVCGESNWTFDLPIATSCCTNYYDAGPASPPTNVLITSTGIVTNGSCPQYTVTESWLITDLCGDSTNCSQTVTVECCTTSNCLNLTCPSNIVVTTCSNCVPVYYAATASACCTNVLTIEYSPVSGTCFPLGTNTVQVAAYACGLVTNCSFTVTVLPGTDCQTNCLLVQCPTNKMEPCGSKWAFNPPTASSCCPSNISGFKTNVLITSTNIVTNGVCPQVITQSWLITDACGDRYTCSQVVTVFDTTPPMINCPTNAVVVTLNSNCELVIPSVSVTASDNCTPLCDLVYSQSPPAGTIVPGPDANVTVTVTDLCGNTNSCTVRVDGVPKAALIVDWPASVIASNCVVPCVFVTARDCACPLTAPRISQYPACGSPVGPGVTAVTVTVTDCNGAIAMKSIPLVIPGEESFLSSLFNTGLDGLGHLLPGSAVDTHYTLNMAPLTPPTGYTAPQTVVVDNLWPWLEVSHMSQWIAPTTYFSPNYYLDGCQGGIYTYTNKFTLPAGANAATASISGRWAADNGGVQIILNGHPTGNTIASPYGFQQWTPFTISSGFTSSQNTLLFVVTNAGASPTGLRVEFTNATLCSTCAPPAILSITSTQSLQEGSTATLAVKAGGTPPFSYQWQFNNANIAGATNSSLGITSINYTNAGLYTVNIANPCGGGTGGGSGGLTGGAVGQVSLQVTPALPWPNASWNVANLNDPLGATFGPDLILTGPGSSTNFALSVGTTEDFGLPDPGGQIVNVMDINSQAGATIQIPLIAESGSATDNSYSVIMDIYEPDTSLGTPSTFFQSIACCVSNLGSGGQDGVGLTLDASNNLHIAGASAGVPFDYPSATPVPVDAWNRVALVVDNPEDGLAGSMVAYLNGLPFININPCPCCIAVVTNILNWTISAPTLFNVPTNSTSTNGEFYISGIQFHAVALTPQMIAGIGSPATGPAPVNQTVVGTQPTLSAVLSGGVVNITWPGNPYALQETTDLSSGVWENSTLPFTESVNTSGAVTTTAVVTPVSSAPAKFYRLIFSP